MGTRTYHIPAVNGYFQTFSGALKIEIYYPDTIDMSIDLDVPLVQITPIRYPLEVSSSNQQFRLASFKISFLNLDDLFETSGVLDPANKDQTFIRVKLDGITYYDFKLLWDQIEKLSWYEKEGNLKYRLIRLTAVDKLKHLETMVLDDASYFDGIFLDELLNNMANLLSLSLVWLDNYSITEDIGLSYGLRNDGSWNDALRLFGLDPQQNLLEFLKKFALAFGMFVFTYKGALYVRQRDYGTIQSIDESQIIQLQKIQNRDEISFVEVFCNKNWQEGLSNPPANIIGNFLHSQKYGQQSASNTRNFRADGTGILDKVYIPAKSGQVYTPALWNYYSPTEVDTTSPYQWLKDTVNNKFYYPGHEVESGMLMQFNDEGIYTFVTDVPTSDTVYFLNPDNVLPLTSKPYTIIRQDHDPDDPATPNPFGYDKYFKTELSVRKTAAIYNNYFIGKEQYRLQYPGLMDPFLKLNFLGKEGFISELIHDLNRNYSIISLRL